MRTCISQCGNYQAGAVVLIYGAFMAVVLDDSLVIINTNSHKAADCWPGIY